MLKIRLQRQGRINQPSYRIIVTEHSRSPKTGSFVEQLGTYNPATKARTLNEARVKYWLSVGAKASGTMHNMLVSVGVVSGKKVNVLPKKTVEKKESSSAEATQAKEEAQADASSEASAKKEEKPTEVQA